MSACRIVSRPIYLVEILVETEIMYMKDYLVHDLILCKKCLINRLVKSLYIHINKLNKIILQDAQSNLKSKVHQIYS